MIVKLLTEHHFELLHVSLKGGCTCSFKSTLIKMPHCWKPHALAHVYLIHELVTASSVRSKAMNLCLLSHCFLTLALSMLSLFCPRCYSSLCCFQYSSTPYAFPQTHLSLHCSTLR